MARKPMGKYRLRELCTVLLMIDLYEKHHPAEVEYGDRYQQLSAYATMPLTALSAVSLAKRSRPVSIAQSIAINRPSANRFALLCAGRDRACYCTILSWRYAI